jgi:hypothetical protein
MVAGLFLESRRGEVPYVCRCRWLCWIGAVPCSAHALCVLAPCLHVHPAQGVAGSRCERFFSLTNGPVTTCHTSLMAVLYSHSVVPSCCGIPVRRA